MTEQEWLPATDPQPLLELLCGQASQRKLRLFAVACCRSVWDHLWTHASCPAVVVAELYADQLVSTDDLDTAQAAVVSQLELFPDEPVYDPAFWACADNIQEDAGWCAWYAANTSTKPFDSPITHGEGDQMRAPELCLQCHFLRDVFGPLPFHPSLPLGPTVLQWQDGIIRLLAEQAYEERQLPSGRLDNTRLAVLADALEEAGCQDQDILGHLRQPEAIHVSGCFVLDLLLDKKRGSPGLLA